uniref:Ubiquitin-like protease family profile domain-containing protein n=1 Tax=Panagrolaimus davidi TaxID=227884 RepID=A0A914PKA2_9BILA
MAALYKNNFNRSLPSTAADPNEIPEGALGTSKKRKIGEEDKKIIGKYGVEIYESDMESLNGWLSDAIVNFIALHLYQKLPDDVKDKVNIVDSNMCDSIKYDPRPDISDIFEHNKINNQRWQFFLFNNNTQNGNIRGTHWSLIVFNKDDQSFYFLDSINTGVPLLVKKFVSKICSYMNVENPMVENITCPKQKNGSDCGVYLVEFQKIIINNIENDRQWNTFEDMSNGYMKLRRKEWKRKIENVAAKHMKDCMLKRSGSVSTIVGPQGNEGNPPSAKKSRSNSYPSCF